MSLLRGPIKSPVRLGDLPYSPDAVHFDGVTYLQCDSLILPPEGGSPGADGSQITIAGWFKAVWDNTFTPVSPSPGKGNTIPVFVVDPDINYGPSVIALTPQGVIFVIAADGTFDGGGNQLTNAINYWSADGITWHVGVSDSDSLLNLQTGSGVAYFNGIWLVNQRYTYDAVNNFITQIVVYSFDGKNWTMGLNPATAGNPAVDNTVVITIDSANNRVNLSNLSCTTVHINAIRRSLPNLQADLNIAPLGNSPKDDPSQPATGTAGYLANSLLSGVTAVRFKSNGVSTPPYTFDYTKTPITTTIVNSGAEWPGATWTTSLTLDSSQTRSSCSFGGVANAINAIGGAPGGTITKPQVQTSIVCQANDNFSDISIGVEDKINFWAISSTVAPLSGEQGLPYALNGFNANGAFWQQPVWMHFMFTCNSDTGRANIYINGVKTDLSGSSVTGGEIITVLPFLTRLNQKIAIVGGDSLGGFYIGDIADFSVWNVDLSQITIIDQNNRQGLTSPYNIFIDPNTNGPITPERQIDTVKFITGPGSGLSPTGFKINQPVIMLTGDHIQFPQNILGSAQPFRIVGNLSNAATNPQTVSSP